LELNEEDRRDSEPTVLQPFTGAKFLRLKFSSGSDLEPGSVKLRLFAEWLNERQCGIKFPLFARPACRFADHRIKAMASAPEVELKDEFPNAASPVNFRSWNFQSAVIVGASTCSICS
jgi:hypothetical protein